MKQPIYPADGQHYLTDEMKEESADREGKNRMFGGSLPAAKTADPDTSTGQRFL